MIKLSIYSQYDYLCDEPFYIEGIGRIKCPTLREIRQITYNEFTRCQSVATLSLDEYLSTRNLTERYKTLSEEEKGGYTLFFLYLYLERNLLQNFFDFFLYDIAVFNENTESFDVYDRNDSNSIIGNISNSNFEILLDELNYIVGQQDEKEKPKFKNKLAEKMYEKLHRGSKKKKKSKDETYDLDNMIRKYCTHNKVGINILNVWDLTYYQFITMFVEYQVGRQFDYSDMLAANSFNYKKASDYKPMEYMKKIK